MVEGAPVEAEAPEVRLFDPYDAAVRADPYALYDSFRAAGRVYRSALGPWFLPRYDDVHAVLLDRRFSSDMRYGAGVAELDAPEVRARLDRRAKVMLFSDPPLHTRLRTLVNKAFTVRVVEGLRPRIEELTRTLLDQAGARGEADLIEALAYPLPLTIIAEMLGVPPEDRPIFAQWSHDLAGNLEPFQTPDRLDAAMRAGEEFGEYFGPLITERRARPTGDLLGRLVAAEHEGDQLDEEELVGLCTLLLVAGHETTVSLIGNGLLALLRSPKQLERLRREPNLMPNAIEELLRYDGIVQLTARVAREDASLGDLAVPRGQVLVLLIAAANRDPERFPDPDVLVVARADPKHLGFGGGAHFCLGAPLARLEARVALGELLRRFDVELASEPRWRESVVLRGMTSFPVRLRARAT